MEKEFKVESKPEFKGGMSESFTNFPKELWTYKRRDLKNSANGKIMVRFVIDDW
jgi:hypothetical protein